MIFQRPYSFSNLLHASSILMEEINKKLDDVENENQALKEPIYKQISYEPEGEGERAIIIHEG